MANNVLVPHAPPATALVVESATAPGVIVPVINNFDERTAIILTPPFGSTAGGGSFTTGKPIFA